MVKKVVATDLDGTLFYPKDHKNMICPANLFFIQSFIDNGGKVIIVSGRSLAYGIKVEKRIGRDVDIVSFNGACIYQNKKVIFSKEISREEVKSIINDVLASYKCLAVAIFTDSGIYVHSKKDSKIILGLSKIYFKWQGVLAEKINFSNQKYQKVLESERIYKILIFFGITKGARNRAMETNKIIRNTYENVESSWSGACIEITYRNINKGEAIKKYCELNHLKKEDIYVVGDSGNDITMFKEFHEHSFAMSHAPKSVKKYAKYSLDKYEDLSRYIY